MSPASWNSLWDFVSPGIKVIKYIAGVRSSAASFYCTHLPPARSLGFQFRFIQFHSDMKSVFRKKEWSSSFGDGGLQNHQHRILCCFCKKVIVSALGQAMTRYNSLEDREVESAHGLMVFLWDSVQGTRGHIHTILKSTPVSLAFFFFLFFISIGYRMLELESAMEVIESSLLFSTGNCCSIPGVAIQSLLENLQCNYRRQTCAVVFQIILCNRHAP